MEREHCGPGPVFIGFRLACLGYSLLVAGQLLPFHVFCLCGGIVCGLGYGPVGFCFRLLV